MAGTDSELAVHPGELFKTSIFGGFHQWGIHKMDGLFHGKSY
jgi:hypothetical protein